MKLFRILWIIPEQNGGIRSYGDALWPSLKKSWSGDALDPVYGLPELANLERWQPDLIHIQHEFGLFGSKVPGLYQFPKWVRKVKKSLPRTRLVATAHTVLPPDYRYPWKGRGAQAPARLLANYTAVPLMRRTWLKGTWGRMNGVIVHAQSQVETVRNADCAKVAEIPHFVPTLPKSFGTKAATPKDIVVFGYLTPEKGTDIAIQAMKHLKSDAKLILAGGLRRDEDRRYHETCVQMIRDAGLGSRIEITGFLKDDEIDARLERASLVLAPFRETSGSGSIVQSIGRGAAILASDLPLNREINARKPQMLAFFRSEDPGDCARQIDRLLADSTQRSRMQAAASEYAEDHSIQKTIEKHLEFYRRL